MILTGQNVSYQVEDKKYILKDVHVSIEKGQKVGIVGANGSGKTTFLKCLTRFNKKSEGQICLMNQNLSQYSKRELAQKIGVMHQLNDFSFDFTIKEMLEMGRYPYFEKRVSLNQKDEEVISYYLEMLELTDKKNQFYSQLSGGEKQKVLLGRALTQTPELLVLDEPTNHLDMYQQRNILKIIQTLNITTLCVLHDLSLAYEFCDVIYMLKEGRVAYYGETKEVLTPNRIADVFGMPMDIIYSDKSNKTHLVAI